MIILLYILFILALIVSKLIIIPLIKVHFYASKDAIVNYVPLFGENLRYFKSVKAHDDYYFN